MTRVRLVRPRGAKRIGGGSLTAVLLAIGLLSPFRLPGEELRTVAEASGFSRTSLHAEVVRFLEQVAARSPRVKLLTLGVSSEGRPIPLVVVSREGIAGVAQLRAVRRPAVLVMGGIHAGEIEGKEACQMLVRDLALAADDDLLKDQVVLFLPIFNPDGNEKLGHNRRDNGPELAGVRQNGQNLDLNRDYMKLESPEVTALASLLSTWDPTLVIDVHTTNGSYHDEPVTYTTMAHPATDPALRDFMWGKLFPAATRELKAQGFESVPYGNFVDHDLPGQGWANDSVDARYGSNYVGLRNRFTVLVEIYSYADFPTRVRSSYAFVKAMLRYTAGHLGEMAELAARIDRDLIARGLTGEYPVKYRMESLFDVTLHLSPASLPPPRSTGGKPLPEKMVAAYATPRSLRLPYLARAVAESSVALPEGYVILPGSTEALATLRRHGIVVERFAEGWSAVAENYQLSTVKPAGGIYQGRVLTQVTGQYVTGNWDIPAGAWYVSLRQPLARLIPALLEPESTDSLLAWGAFNRVIVQQWNPRPGVYPVLRLAARPPVATTVVPPGPD